MSTMSPRSDHDGLGSLLLRARRTQGRSQQRLAQELCQVAGTATVSRHEISRWEREERIPSSYWLAWLGVVLGRPAAELERATAHTRQRRARARSVTPPGTSSWPWRVVACRVRSERGRIVLRIIPAGGDVDDHDGRPAPTAVEAPAGPTRS